MNSLPQRYSEKQVVLNWVTSLCKDILDNKNKPKKNRSLTFDLTLEIKKYFKL